MARFRCFELSASRRVSRFAGAFAITYNYNVTPSTRISALFSPTTVELYAALMWCITRMYAACHELRNPLHALSAVLEFVHEDGGLTDALVDVSSLEKHPFIKLAICSFTYPFTFMLPPSRCITTQFDMRFGFNGSIQADTALMSSDRYILRLLTASG